MKPLQLTTYYAPRTAAAVIIANMIGTGVFTSLGFQLLDIQTGFPLLMLWVLGGRNDYSWPQSPWQRTISNPFYSP